MFVSKSTSFSPTPAPPQFMVDGHHPSSPFFTVLGILFLMAQFCQYRYLNPFFHLFSCSPLILFPLARTMSSSFVLRKRPYQRSLPRSTIVNTLLVTVSLTCLPHFSTCPLRSQTTSFSTFSSLLYLNLL